MASLNSKIKLYLEANSKIYKDEIKNYTLYNASDGTGDVIQSWNVAGLTQPTASQLNALDSNASTLESNDIVGTTRENKYGKILEIESYREQAPVRNDVNVIWDLATHDISILTFLLNNLSVLPYSFQSICLVLSPLLYNLCSANSTEKP